MPVILLPQRWRNQPQGNVKLRPDWAGIVAAYVCGDRYFDGKDEGRIQPTTQQIFRPSVQGLAFGTIADSTPIALQVHNGPTFTDWGFVFVGRKVAHTSFDAAAGFANSASAYLELSTGSVSSDLRPTATGLVNHFSLSSLSGTPTAGALVGSYSTALSTGYIYVDGQVVASGAHTYTANAPVLYLALGGRYLATNRNWRGNSELLALLGQKQGQEIARDLSIDPWQMFAADPVRIYFDLGAGGGGTDASASGSLAAVSLVAPTGSATAWRDAAGAGAIAAVSLVAPTGSAAAATDAAASGSLAGVSLAPPTGSASSGTDASASGALAAVSLTAPTGSATAWRDAAGSGVLAAVSLTAPTGTASAGTDASASGTLAAISLTAPAGSASSGTDASASGTLAAISLTPPTGSASAVQNASASGVFASVTLSRVLGSASSGELGIVFPNPALLSPEKAEPGITYGGIAF